VVRCLLFEGAYSKEKTFTACTPNADTCLNERQFELPTDLYRSNGMVLDSALFYVSEFLGDPSAHPGSSERPAIAPMPSTVLSYGWLNVVCTLTRLSCPSSLAPWTKLTTTFSVPSPRNISSALRVDRCASSKLSEPTSICWHLTLSPRSK
jgi:hypothetical protein